MKDAAAMVRYMPSELKTACDYMYDDPEEALFMARKNCYDMKNNRRCNPSITERLLVEYYFNLGKIRTDIKQVSFFINRLFYYFALYEDMEYSIPIDVDYFILRDANGKNDYASANRIYDSFIPAHEEDIAAIKKEIKRIVGNKDLSDEIIRKLEGIDDPIDLESEFVNSDKNISYTQLMAAERDLSLAIMSNDALMKKIGTYISVRNSLDAQIERMEASLAELKEKQADMHANTMPFVDLSKVRKIKRSTIEKLDDAIELDEETKTILDSLGIYCSNDLYYHIVFSDTFLIKKIGKDTVKKLRKQLDDVYLKQ